MYLCYDIIYNLLKWSQKYHEIFTIFVTYKIINNGLYMRPVVYCNNVTGLIEYLKSKRELDDSCSLQVGIDGGGGNSLIVL